MRKRVRKRKKDKYKEKERERKTVRAIIFLNRLGHSEKSAKYFMSHRPTYYTYQNHADFLNLPVFPGDFEFSRIVCN